MSNAVKGIICIVVLLLALSAVVGLGAWLAGRHYQPTIDSLNDKLSKCGSLKDQANATIHSRRVGKKYKEVRGRIVDGPGVLPLNGFVCEGYGMTGSSVYLDESFKVHKMGVTPP